MNGLEKSIHELINMLVQYEATTNKSDPAILVGEASTSKAKGKGVRRWKWKKGKGTAVTTTASTGGAPPASPKGKGKGKVLERSRRLSKDEMVLRCCGRLSIPARGGFSYVITFIDDHSRYGYVHLMRYKSEAFGRFKEYKLEVENETNKIKALRSDRGVLRNCPFLLGYAFETAAKLLNIAPSKSVPQTLYEVWHGKPASYKYLRVWGSSAYVKRLVGDKLDSRSTLCRFIGYPKETAGYYFYDPVEQKIFVSRNAVFLKKGFPSDSRRDEVLIKESSEEPQHDSTTSFEPIVHTDGVPVLRRSTRES
ncbi:UNVERIFIED_CONTAM: hypothetical protein Sradi_0707500 [Sesamum radiatum]|uniref:Retroviral polymerase SH3-like domain-containing protein n=1 Tax=Sesamum radiatum TaxID=300843 RepID=A0AAW2VRY2_SESRA